MRLNKAKREILLNYALENASIDPKIQSKAEKTRAKFIMDVGAFLSKKLGSDLPTLKKHDAVFEVGTLSFETYRDKKDKFKTTTRITGLKGNNLYHANGLNTQSYNTYIDLPAAVKTLGIKLVEQEKEVKLAEKVLQQDFDTIIRKHTTFKALCTTLPMFENAAHLVMAETSLVATNEELLTRISKYTKKAS